MGRARKSDRLGPGELTPTGYDCVLAGVIELLESARRASARAVNAVITATYWEIGRRIVESEQGGNDQAAYGAELIDRLAADLTKRFGRGFGRSNLYQMRAFYVAYRQIVQTASGQFIPDSQLLSLTNAAGEPTAKDAPAAPARTDEKNSDAPAHRFPLPWSHYVKLLSVEDANAREFYEAEALRNGWTVRQLDR